MNDIEKAIESMDAATEKASKCPFRPKFHFLPPSQWMNDPNGTIFYKGEYHVFYQYNPYGDRWGHMHWGHCKSKDLINWELLPIALAPLKEKGEKHCFSGCCVNNNGTPTIIYTSISSLPKVKKGAEQWSAISKDDMISWESSVENPIMTDDLHTNINVWDWRDPYVWRENNKWYCVLGGHILKDKKGSAFLYESDNLIDWKYIGVLCSGTRKQGRNWECPNFFELNGKHILAISPHKNVIYTIGEYKDFKFNSTSNKWYNLDIGNRFYATNTLRDANGRLILFGWIRDGGSGGWNGILSLPRVLTINSKGRLEMDVASELETLRGEKISYKSININDENGLPSSINLGDCIEFEIKLKINDAKIFGIKIIDGKGEETKIIINKKKKIIKSSNQKGKLQLIDFNNTISIHGFIDTSVIELIINKIESITSRFYPDKSQGNDLTIDLFSEKGSVQVESFDCWKINPINISRNF